MQLRQRTPAADSVETTSSLQETKKKIQESTRQMFDQLKAAAPSVNTENVSNGVKLAAQTGKKILDATQLTEIFTNPNVPNYKISALSTLMSVAQYYSSAEGSLSHYLSLLGIFASIYLTAEQSGVFSRLNFFRANAVTVDHSGKEEVVELSSFSPRGP